MRITLIGSGNVATHLGAAFKNAGHQMVQVYSRDISNAALLAFYIGAEPVHDLSNLHSETDLFIIAVKDDAIVPVAQQVTRFEKLLVHTSGSAGLQVLLDCTPKAGVLYPLQTLSKNKQVDFNAVPICIEGTDISITNELDELAHTISKSVYRVNSDQRKILHLAAVFASNFPNYLYGVARQLLARHDMGFDMLRPLILETAQKVQDHVPNEVLTGPAVRNDESTMAAHLEMLNDEPQLKELYALLSQGIIKMDNAGHGHK